MNMQKPLPDLRVHRAGHARGAGRSSSSMMAAKDPDARIQSCDAVVAALDDIEARLRTGTASFDKRTDQAAAVIPATNVHASRPPAVRRRRSRPGLQSLDIPPKRRRQVARRRSPISVGVGAAVLVARRRPWS